MDVFLFYADWQVKCSSIVRWAWAARPPWSWPTWWFTRTWRWWTPSKLSVLTGTSHPTLVSWSSFGSWTRSYTPRDHCRAVFRGGLDLKSVHKSGLYSCLKSVSEFKGDITINIWLCQHVHLHGLFVAKLITCTSLPTGHHCLYLAHYLLEKKQRQQQQKKRSANFWLYDKCRWQSRNMIESNHLHYYNCKQSHQHTSSLASVTPICGINSPPRLWHL